MKSREQWKQNDRGGDEEWKAAAKITASFWLKCVKQLSDKDCRPLGVPFRKLRVMTINQKCSGSSLQLQVSIISPLISTDPTCLSLCCVCMHMYVCVCFIYVFIMQVRSTADSTQETNASTESWLHRHGNWVLLSLLPHPPPVYVSLSGGWFDTSRCYGEPPISLSHTHISTFTRSLFFIRHTRGNS